MATSRYIQITEWALLEYEYASEVIPNTQAKAYKLENAYDDSIQFLNGDIAINLTGNVQDKSSAVQSTVGNKWGYLDIDTIVPIIGSDTKLTLTEQTSNLTSNIEYDKVKLHIVSGYNLDGLDGLIAQLSITERSGKRVDLSNFTFLSGENDYNFNTKPLFLGDRLYDKYIEFKIPAFSWIQTEYYANTVNVGAFGYIYSSNNEGFVKESFINFTLHEIQTTNVENGNKFFVTGNKYETSFLSADQFGLLGATLRESSEGDYFEFFGTWDNGFPDDYILNLNSVGGDWVIVHQLDIFEQVGVNSFRTNNMTMLQEFNFETPNIFRPVIINSDTASSFSIDYIMRFLNRADGQQILRESSYTSYEPKKYGKELEKITVSEGYKPLKVYNKIVSGEEQASTTSFQQNSPETFKTITTTKFVPNFYSNTNVALTTIGKSTQELSDTIWGQGKAIVLLNEFDNRIRFKMFDKSPSDGEYEQLDLTTEPSISLSFVLDDGTKVYVEQSVDVAGDVDPTAGEIEFLIPSETSQQALEQDVKRFYIVSKGGEGDTETVLYQGKYENFANRDDVNDELTNERESDIDKKIQELEKARNKAASEQTSLDKKIAENTQLEREIERERNLNQNILSETSKQTAILRTEEERLRIELERESEAIAQQNAEILELLAKLSQEQESDRPNPKIKYREIPGQTVDLSSGFKRVKPKVLKPSKPGTTVEKLKSDKKR